MSDQPIQNMRRRDFLTRSSLSLGSLALSQLSWGANNVNPVQNRIKSNTHKPKVRRIVYLFQSGGPSQLDTWDYKPELQKWHGSEMPSSIMQGQRLTGMSGNQSAFPVASPMFSFQQYGESGTWLSELMPYTSEIVDDLCIIKSLNTDAINHDPAITFLQTGSQLPGRPSIGAWLNYGLGSMNDNLPSFIVLVSKNGGGQPLYARLWGNGFLESRHQGVQFRSGADPVLYLNNPDGYDGVDRREMLDYLRKLNQVQQEAWGDPEIASRIAQYELAYRMQTSVPEVNDLSDEPDHIFDLYGPDSRDPGTYAANCLLARRLLERDVKFVQLYHQGWDQHLHLPKGIRNQCKNTDQATAALVKDLGQRGLLDDTLVIWGGEFGRTVYTQGKLTRDNYGRDHHPRCFTVWMAGAGVKKGFTYGSTDDFGYSVAKDPIHVHDFHATLLHLLGIDHEQLTFKHQGRRYRLTDVHGHVVKDLLS